MYEYAQGRGVEPLLTGPKPAVLPLDDPRVSCLTPRLTHDNTAMFLKF
jgi:hypothetical protein